jgi:hypothetical protein
MPFVSTRAKLVLSEPDAIWLRHLTQSRTVAAAKVQRAQILLHLFPGRNGIGDSDAAAHQSSQD